MSLVTIAKTTAPEKPFGQHAPRVGRDPRAALLALMQAVPTQPPIRKATDLERALELPTTFAGKVFTVAQADDPMTQVNNIPGLGAMKRVFEAASKRGVPSRIVTATRVAFAEFDDL